MLPARYTLGLLAGLALIAPSTAYAQDGYLFKQPVVSIAVRAGAALPSANDDLHNVFMREFTLGRGDFRSAMVGADASFVINPRMDLTVGASYSKSNSNSEYRDWVGVDDLPIAQHTSVRRVPLTAGVKFYPVERGRSLSRYAWVPNTVLPYAGAGAGIMFYKVELDGEFVDEDLDVVPDYLASSGNAPMLNLFGGLEWWAHPRFGLNLEGRYHLASAKLDPDFSPDIEKINLRGFQLTAGVVARF